jgi:hypothetical protein
VTRYDVAFPTLPLAFLPDRLGRAAVTMGDVRCLHAAETRFVCPAGAVEVERSVRDVEGVPRPCLTARAPTGLGVPLAIEFPVARIGRTLHGHVGPLGAASGAPVRIAVALEGEEIGSAEVSLATWVPFRIDMTRIAGSMRPLSLVLTSPGPLDVCLDAVVLP